MLREWRYSHRHLFLFPEARPDGAVVLMARGIVNSYSAGWAEGRQQRDRQTKCAAAVKDFRHVDPQ